MADFRQRPARDPGKDQALLREIDRLSRGDEFPRAVEIAKAALDDGLEHPLLLNLLAFDFQQAGRLEEAIGFWDRALELDPDQPSLLTAKGVCLSLARRHRDAASAYERALLADPRNLRALVGLGNSLINFGEFGRAKSAFAGALELAPREVEALVGLGTIAVREGATDAASGFASRATAAAPRHSRALLLHAEIAASLRDPVEAETWARRACDSPGISGADKAPALIALGDALDGQARYAEAFAAYADGKAAARTFYRSEFRAPGRETALAQLQRLADRFGEMDPAAWREPAPGTTGRDAIGHAFLVGFPRSGTTLLENVLAAQEDVVALDERPTLPELESAFLADPEGLDRLAALGEAEASSYRELYWRRVAEYASDVRGKFVLDKRPLGTRSLPIIAKLFPDARVILAVRDPRDVVFSCFRRAFAMNPSMYEFTSLEGAARFYDAMMRLAQTYLAGLALDCRRTRHETLVTDFDVEMPAICDHLGLTWRPDMRDYAGKAARRAIRSPGASQVRRGLTTEGFGRWRAYESEMAAVAPILEPWVKAFGY